MTVLLAASGTPHAPPASGRSPSPRRSARDAVDGKISHITRAHEAREFRRRRRLPPPAVARPNHCCSPSAATTAAQLRAPLDCTLNHYRRAYDVARRASRQNTRPIKILIGALPFARSLSALRSLKKRQHGTTTSRDNSKHLDRCLCSIARLEPHRASDRFCHPSPHRSRLFRTPLPPHIPNIIIHAQRCASSDVSIDPGPHSMPRQCICLPPLLPFGDRSSPLSLSVTARYSSCRIRSFCSHARLDNIRQTSRPIKS